MLRRACVLLLGALVLAQPCEAASSSVQVVLPENRQAYYSDESIELSVAGLGKGDTADITLMPDRPGLAPVTFRAVGDGSSVTVVLPPLALAPSGYGIQIDGKSRPSPDRITVVRGVPRSPFLVSQTIALPRVPAAGGNFAVSHSFESGLLDADGRPSLDLRRRSRGMTARDTVVAMDLPSLIYMYWTGYVLHKPWGSDKAWVDPSMTEAMRLFSFHTAQRLRRYRRNIVSVGTLDEPGLAWGATPAGGTASGFPQWNERAWYEARGWSFTTDPASRPDDDWMKYLTVRASILHEQNLQARKDLRTVWPEVVFATDLYAAHALLDGTEPLNQRVNDVVTTHVFDDWGHGKLGNIGAAYLEKAHQPLARVAHAKNGQLFGRPVAQPGTRHAYHLMMNALLAAGLQSNWWLNVGPMKDEDLSAVNEPAERLGPLFLAMTPDRHDVAVLWSFTELGMRLKDVTAREAAKRPGAPIMLTVDGGDVEIDAYRVGGNYREEVLAMFQAINRAGYPAHIVHESLLPGGALKDYRTLVIVGQTVEPPAPIRKAIERFVAEGGTVIVDAATAVRFGGAIVTDAQVRNAHYRWLMPWVSDEKKFASPREASYYKTNEYMDDLARVAAPAIKRSLKATAARPAVVTDSAFLAAERHRGGDGELIMVLNGYEKLPDVADSEPYPIYNHAPYRASLSVSGLPAGGAIYLIEGLDWKRVSRVRDPGMPHTLDFAPGEMKLYLVAPRAPRGIDLRARADGGRLELSAGLQGARMPWPLHMTLKNPAGEIVTEGYRAMNAQGKYRESLPLGLNAPAGRYTVSVTSPVAALAAEVVVPYQPLPVRTRIIADAARVFDAPAIRSFLAGKPSLVIATGSGASAPIADTLASALAARGIPTRVAPEGSVWRKARYPRVWDPYIAVHRKADADSPMDGIRVTREVALETAADGSLMAVLADGQNIGERWRTQSGTLATIVGGGFIDYQAQPERFYEAGCKLYVADKLAVQVLNGRLEKVQSTEDVRARWSRPWQRLETYFGAANLVPQLPEAYAVDSHLILLGDSSSSELIRALQASDVLPQVVDTAYPGPGKALVSFAWSPFALEKNVILIGAGDDAGMANGVGALLDLIRRP